MNIAIALMLVFALGVYFGNRWAKASHALDTALARIADDDRPFEARWN